MPTYEYFCEVCNLLFDKSGMKVGDTKTDCPACKTSSERQISIPNVGRSGTSRDSTDLLIGKEAESRWKDIETRKAEKDKIRKETGTHAIATEISKDDQGKIKYEYKPVSKERLEERKTIYSEYKKLESEGEKK